MQNSTLVLVSGPAGCGKSTLSKGLAKYFKLVHLDKDCIDEPFSPGDRGKNYTDNIEPKVIQALLNLTQLNLNNQMSVIIDLPWTHILINSPEWKTKLERFNPLILEIKISEATLKERITKRGLSRDQVKLTEKGWEDFKITDCIGELNPMNHLLLDGELSPEDIFKSAILKLSDI